MIWYRHLYLGEKAKKKRFWIIQNIRFHRPQLRAYVITPAVNSQNILDIYPAPIFALPYYRKQNLTVLGIGADYWEALEVSGQIIQDVYEKTGGLDLQAFLNLQKAQVN